MLEAARARAIPSILRVAAVVAQPVAAALDGRATRSAERGARPRRRARVLEEAGDDEASRMYWRGIGCDALGSRCTRRDDRGVVRARARARASRRTRQRLEVELVSVDRARRTRADAGGRGASARSAALDESRRTASLAEAVGACARRAASLPCEGRSTRRESWSATAVRRSCDGGLHVTAAGQRRCARAEIEQRPVTSRPGRRLLRGASTSSTSSATGSFCVHASRCCLAECLYEQGARTTRRTTLCARRPSSGRRRATSSNFVYARWRSRARCLRRRADGRGRSSLRRAAVERADATDYFYVRGRCADAARRGARTVSGRPKSRDRRAREAIEIRDGEGRRHGGARAARTSLGALGIELA